MLNRSSLVTSTIFHKTVINDFKKEFQYFLLLFIFQERHQREIECSMDVSSYFLLIRRVETNKDNETKVH